MAHTYHRGLETQPAEIVVDDIPVQGEIPDWLTGSLLRIGPGKFEAGKQELKHWFDGYAMVHRFAFHQGKVGYANAYLKTRAYEAAREGKMAYREFATDPCRNLFQKFFSAFSRDEIPYSDNANVSIARIGGEFVAMTETPMPVFFDPVTLDTLKIDPPNDDVDGQLTTAHPHHDFERSTTFNYVTHFGKNSFYNIICYHTPLRRELLATVPAPLEPAYMHSFAMTENYVILTESPFVFDIVQLATDMLTHQNRAVIHYFRWKPERNTRFTVISKADGSIQGRYEADAFATFHHINAFEEADAIHIDACAYDDANAYTDGLYLNQMRNPETKLRSGQFRRYTIHTRTADVDYAVMSDESIDLPNVNYKGYNAKPYRYAYGISESRQHVDKLFNQLIKVDTAQRETKVWTHPDQYPNEPVFVARPDATAEDDGVILSSVLDGTTGTSYLLVLDAQSFDEMGRAQVGQHIPFNFHGQFFGDVP